MSESTRLRVGISAEDTASASIQRLNSTVKALEASVAQLNNLMTASSGISIPSIQREIDARQSQISMINTEIAKRREQKKTVDDVTKALKEQGEAAAVVHRSLSQGIDASFGISAQNAIKGAVASTTVLGEAMVAAEAKAQRTAAAIAATSAKVGESAATNSTAILKEADAERALAAAATEAELLAL